MPLTHTRRPPDPRSDEFPPPGQPLSVAEPGEMFSVRTPGRGFTTTSLTLAAVSLIFPPAVIGGVGFGIAAQRRGDPWARRVILIAIVAMVAGAALAVVAANLEPDAFASAAVRTQP